MEYIEGAKVSQRIIQAEQYEGTERNEFFCPRNSLKVILLFQLHDFLLWVYTYGSSLW